VKKAAKSKYDDASTKQLWVNRLVTCSVVSAGGAFVLAIYLGAFAKTEMRELASWVTALAAVASVMVAVVAIMYVAQTLKATRDTLDATRNMAIEQTRIGDSQIRPYIVFERLSNETFEDGIGSVEIVFKNVGATPASNITFDSTFELSEVIEIDEDHNVWHTVEHENQLDEKYCAALSQNSVHTVFDHNIHLTDIDRSEMFELLVTCRYRNFDRTKTFRETHKFSMLNEDGRLVTRYK
jgi:ABC-type nickel/cobalt efflux system permease component RcnA